jgi:hypothetical protein
MFSIVKRFHLTSTRASTMAYAMQTQAAIKKTFQDERPLELLMQASPPALARA